MNSKEKQLNDITILKQVIDAALDQYDRVSCIDVPCFECPLDTKLWKGATYCEVLMVLKKPERKSK